MWELDCEEGWVLKNWCFWTVVLEKTLESPLDFTEIQPVYPKGHQSWMFIGRTDAEAETPAHVKSWLIGKDPDAGRDWGQEEKGTTEDEMAGWHHWLDGHEFEWTPGVGDGQGGLACWDSWGLKESDMTEWLTELDKQAANHWIKKTLWSSRHGLELMWIMLSINLLYCYSSTGLYFWYIQGIENIRHWMYFYFQIVWKKFLCLNNDKKFN